MTKHKYSTIALVAFGILILIAWGIAIESEDLDEICNINDSILYRSPTLDKWVCGKTNDVITVYNLTIINNKSIYESSRLNVTENAYFNGDITINETVNSPYNVEINPATGYGTKLYTGSGLGDYVMFNQSPPGIAGLPFTFTIESGTSIGLATSVTLRESGFFIAKPPTGDALVAYATILLCGDRDYGGINPWCVQQFVMDFNNDSNLVDFTSNTFAKFSFDNQIRANTGMNNNGGYGFNGDSSLIGRCTGVGNNICFNTSLKEAMRIDENQRVSIGGAIADPIRTLDVGDYTSDEEYIRIAANENKIAGIELETSFATTRSTKTAILAMPNGKGWSNSDLWFIMRNNTGANDNYNNITDRKFVMRNDGRLGIGYIDRTDIDYNLDVNGTSRFKGAINQTEDKAFINNIYGSMYYFNQSARTINISVQNKWYNMTLFDDCGYLNGISCNATTGVLSPDYSSIYEVNYVSVGTGQINHSYEATISVNGIPLNRTRTIIQTDAQVTKQLIGQGFLNLSKGDEIRFAFRDITGTGNIKIYSVNVNLKRLSR